MTSEREPRMTRVFSHIKSNAVAYLALFVALGGTSYAALRIPAGSVGARQLKNHSITPIKFDRSAIGGYVRYWAKIDAAGTISASRPRAHLVDWVNQPTAAFPGGFVSWNRADSLSLLRARRRPPVHPARRHLHRSPAEIMSDWQSELPRAWG